MSAHATHQTAPPQRADPQRATTHQSLGTARGGTGSISRLQRTVGNRALSALLRSRVIQPKLEISEPEDEFEREADQVADEVMRMPDPQSATTPLHAESSIGYSQSRETHNPSIPIARAPVHISRMCAGCEADHKEREPEAESQTEQKEEEKEEEEDEGKFVQAKFAAPDPPEPPKNLDSDLNNSHDRGTPLSKPLRNFFEPRFGADLSGVRLHQNARSAELAEQINARAFTLGQDVYFGAGQYAPSTNEGQRLIAHELTHTLQQSGVEPAAAPANQASLTEPEQEPDEREEEPEKEPVQPGERKPDEPGTQPIVSNTGLILPHYALSLVLPIMRMPIQPMIQRRANVSLAPPGLPCILMDVTGTPGELDIFFDKDGAGLNAANLALIENYVGIWVSRGLSPDLMVSGYASTDGSQRHNWRLSCQRAEAVQTELVRIGVPQDKTSIFAHGETNDFDTTNLEPNRRATIDSVPGTGPTITPTLTPHDNFAGRSLARFGLSEVIDVDYNATPGITAAEHFGVEWRLVTGTGTIVNLPGRPDTYTAGNVPATEQLALVVSSGPALGTQLMLVNIPVIAPITSYMQQVPGSGLCHTTGRASVGFRGNPFMLPADVSFTGIQWREGTGTTIASGSLSGLNGNPHTIGGWMSIGTGSVATGCMVNTVDSVSTSTTAVGAGGDWTGLQVWPIQWEYQAPGAAVMPLVVAVHLCIIDAAGTATISKALAGPFSRALGDVTSCVAAGLLPAPHCC